MQPKLYVDHVRCGLFVGSLSAHTAGFCNGSLVEDRKLLVLPSDKDSCVDIVDVQNRKSIGQLIPDVSKERAGKHHVNLIYCFYFYDKGDFSSRLEIS